MTRTENRRAEPMRNWHLIPLLILAACGAPGTATDENAVIFEIDMTGPSKDGWFDPTKDEVGLRGSVEPLTWNSSLPMTDEDGDNVWEAEVQFDQDAPAVVQYKVFVTGDGHPNGGWERGDNRTFNRASTRRVRRAYEDTTEPLPPTYTGNVQEHAAFGSGDLVPARNLYVWLPPGYDEEPDRRYPVLYMHDGQNVFDQRAAGMEWEMDETATRLVEAGEIEPIIIVGVANTSDRTLEYTPAPGGWEFQLERTPGEADGADPLAGTYRIVGEEAPMRAVVRGSTELEIQLPGDSTWSPAIRTQDGYMVPGPQIQFRVDSSAAGRVQRFTATRRVQGGAGQEYANFLVDEVKPFIDATYRTLPGREHTAVGGSSLGGLITMSIGVWDPTVFGGLLVVSPSVHWAEGVILDMVEGGPAADSMRIWLDMGTAEGFGALRGARQLRDVLTEMGWTPGEDLMYVEDEGAEHNERAWAGRVEGMLRFLYGRKTEPGPSS